MTTEAPLSYAQQLLAAFAVHDGGSVFGGGFVNWCAHELTGPVAPDLLQEALDELVVRHSGLRTLVVRDEGFPFQRVAEPAPVPLRIHDATASTVDERLRITAEITAEALTRPLPPDRVPLMAADLVRFGPDVSSLILLIHRTVADGWTMQVAIRDVVAAYERRRRGTSASVAPVPQYADHATAEAAPEREKRIQEALPYWREQLSGVRRVGIPADRPRPLSPKAAVGEKALHTFELPDGVVAGLRSRARTLRTTEFTLLLTAYAVALAGHAEHAEHAGPAGQTRIAVPVLSAGRGAGDWDGIGFYLNGHVLRLDLSGTMTVAEAAAHVHHVNTEALRHDVPLIRILEELPELAEAAFEARDVVPAPMQLCRPIPRSEDPDATVHYRRLGLPPAVVRETPVMPVDFLWVMEPYASFVVRVTYDPAMFEVATVERIAARFRATADRLVTAPDTLLADLLMDEMGVRR
ncbi:MAG: hypothetical protein HOU81_06200 [Hamadaea sp.]|uniref:condensation domain-containing protein n=1 Tax=Hamadaea sp. TaxID=2024425 RepID=UPI00181E65C8|nr:condensation domain-containing protein [Hamadaea sp.]NUR70391.1 hypothetical protein [Hamadaea sp.]NUT20551.1 hypothetical protein [Hamadaea sp.]